MQLSNGTTPAGTRACVPIPGPLPIENLVRPADGATKINPEDLQVVIASDYSNATTAYPWSHFSSVMLVPNVGQVLSSAPAELLNGRSSSPGLPVAGDFKYSRASFNFGNVSHSANYRILVDVVPPSSPGCPPEHHLNVIGSFSTAFFVLRFRSGSSQRRWNNAALRWRRRTSS